MPTLDEITLTPEMEALMVEMIEDVNSASTALKALVRYQKWTKRIWQAGATWQREQDAKINLALIDKHFHTVPVQETKCAHNINWSRCVACRLPNKKNPIG